ncbi:MAG: glycerol kinase GlpK [Deltaproteobacteria bacterium]|nr:glycerol kinase GlpK [Deltaproteobacteria bacterium]
MSSPAIMAIDQGTTSSRAMVFNPKGEILAVAQEPFAQMLPKDGWVEHDAEVIWATTLKVIREAALKAEAVSGPVLAIGITNQRETTIVWDRQNGKPLYPAIVWQDRRTAKVCSDLVAAGLASDIASRTGLIIDPYFSATKVAWILDNVPKARRRAETGQLAFGTVDSFLIWRLTGGKVHATDATNASRTSLYNIHLDQWDTDLLRIFNVPASVLPEVRDSAAAFGHTLRDILGYPVPILGVAGDQQAAAIGQCCFSKGQIKSTFGTGCFVLMNTGNEVIPSESRLLSTIAYRLNGTCTYALEGSIFIAGAAIQWLRDELGILKSAEASAALAASLSGNSGVYMVPAFTGLGAPYWDPDARGTICGLSRGTGPAELVRAALESVAYQTNDLLLAMAADGIHPTVLKVDGAMAANDWLMRFLANITTLNIERPSSMETTALGAAFLAGYQAGIYTSLEELTATWRCHRRFHPTMTGDERKMLLNGWRDAVGRTTPAPSLQH